ncbi:MAG: hypothetical protein LBT93_06610, partial [Treponema sp.]|nr:hypothetical protein [Treponema sp.]
MEYFTEQALTYSECLENIRNKYGGRATILMHKNIRMGGFLGFFAKDGVEVTGFVPNNAGKSLNALTEIPPPRMPPPRPAVITDSVGTSGSSVIQQNNSDFEEKKRQVLAAANRGTDTSWQKVLEEVQIIRGKIEAREKAPAVPEEEHQALGRIREILETN